MKLFFLSLVLLIVNNANSQRAKENSLKATGYYIKPFDKPILYLLYNKSDTLKLLTNTLEGTDQFLKPSMIESMEVLKGMEAIKKYKELGQYGVVVLGIKNENWESISSNKNKINALDISKSFKNRNDTIHLKQPEISSDYKKIAIGTNHLIVRENGSNFNENNIQLFIKKTNSNKKAPKEAVALEIGLKEAEKISEKRFKINPHSETQYSLIYDTTMNKIIWNASACKIMNGKKSNNHNNFYHNQNGNITLEIIELDAMTGKIISQHIDDEVEIRIR